VAVAVSQDAFESWHDRMLTQGKAVHCMTACNPGLSTYFINSQSDTVYHRPQTIIGSRRFARRSPLTDYDFQRRPALRGRHASKGALGMTEYPWPARSPT